MVSCGTWIYAVKTKGVSPSLYVLAPHGVMWDGVSGNVLYPGQESIVCPLGMYCSALYNVVCGVMLYLAEAAPLYGVSGWCLLVAGVCLVRRWLLPVFLYKVVQFLAQCHQFFS